MIGERQVNVKSNSELDIGGRETCFYIALTFISLGDLFMQGLSPEV